MDAEFAELFQKKNALLEEKALVEKQITSIDSRLEDYFIERSQQIQEQVDELSNNQTPGVLNNLASISIKIAYLITLLQRQDQLKCRRKTVYYNNDNPIQIKGMHACNDVQVILISLVKHTAVLFRLRRIPMGMSLSIEMENYFPIYWIT